MDLTYQFPTGEGQSSSMEIVLDPDDLEQMGQLGYCTDRRGLCGTDSKTWVRIEDWAKLPNASIDTDGDLNISLPTGVGLPVEIPNDKINWSQDHENRDGVEWYFGKLGSITIREA